MCLLFERARCCSVCSSHCSRQQSLLPSERKLLDKCLRWFVAQDTRFTRRTPHLHPIRTSGKQHTSSCQSCGAGQSCTAVGFWSYLCGGDHNARVASSKFPCSIISAGKKLSKTILFLAVYLHRITSTFSRNFIWYVFVFIQGPITAVNFSRNGEFFASGGADEQVSFSTGVFTVALPTVSRRTVSGGGGGAWGGMKGHDAKERADRKCISGHRSNWDWGIFKFAGFYFSPFVFFEKTTSSNGWKKNVNQ